MGSRRMEEVAQLTPDVVLLDVQLPDLDGFAVAELLAATGVTTDVVLISSREAAWYGPRLPAAAARGFLRQGGAERCGAARASIA